MINIIYIVVGLFLIFLALSHMNSGVKSAVDIPALGMGVWIAFSGLRGLMSTSNSNEVPKPTADSVDTTQVSSSVAPEDQLRSQALSMSSKENQESKY